MSFLLCVVGVLVAAGLPCLSFVAGLRGCGPLEVGTLLALPVAIVTYATWPRTRYFGNTAPLLLAVLFVILGMAHPHEAGTGFLLGAIPFLFIFVSGVLADLMETQYRPLVTAGVFGMLLAYAVWSVAQLAKVKG